MSISEFENTLSGCTVYEIVVPSKESLGKETAKIVLCSHSVWTSFLEYLRCKSSLKSQEVIEYKSNPWRFVSEIDVNNKNVQ